MTEPTELGWARVTTKDGAHHLGNVSERSIAGQGFISVVPVIGPGELLAAVTVERIQLMAREEVVVLSSPFFIERMKQTVAAHFGYSVEEMEGHDRPDDLVIARHIFVRLASDCGYKTPAIGRALNKDTSSIFYALKSFSDRVATKPEVAIPLLALREKLCIPAPLKSQS